MSRNSSFGLKGKSPSFSKDISYLAPLKFGDEKGASNSPSFTKIAKEMEQKFSMNRSKPSTKTIVGPESRYTNLFKRPAPEDSSNLPVMKKTRSNTKDDPVEEAKLPVKKREKKAAAKAAGEP